jgi:hypothetical protein
LISIETGRGGGSVVFGGAGALSVEVFPSADDGSLGLAWEGFEPTSFQIRSPPPSIINNATAAIANGKVFDLG